MKKLISILLAPLSALLFLGMLFLILVIACYEWLLNEND